MADFQSLLNADVARRVPFGIVAGLYRGKRAGLRRWVAPAFALLAAIVGGFSPAAAQDAWLKGEWCADNGERMVVERSGLGFNEHTMCTWRTRPQRGNRVNVMIDCANYYGNGEKAFARRERFRAVSTGATSISVRVGDGSAVAYRRCD